MKNFSESGDKNNSIRTLWVLLLVPLLHFISIFHVKTNYFAEWKIALVFSIIITNYDTLKTTHVYFSHFLWVWSPTLFAWAL